MEVMGSCGMSDRHAGQRLDMQDVDRRLVALGTLEQPLREQERLAGDDEPQPIEGFPLHEQVGDAGFVLQ